MRISSSQYGCQKTSDNLTAGMISRRRVTRQPAGAWTLVIGLSTRRSTLSAAAQVLPS